MEYEFGLTQGTLFCVTITPWSVQSVRFSDEKT